MERISYQDIPEGLVSAVLKLQAYINKAGLDPKLHELLCMRVSQINGCAYCLDMHYKEAIHAGEEPIRLISLPAWRETTYYTPKEQAALAFAEALTRLPDNGDHEHLHEELLKHFTKPEIAVLTLAISQTNTWNRLNISFGTVAGNYKVGQF
jgi:AhpD family alkylhydroperoxidase